MGRMFRQEHGFTIAELMLVIVLVGLLSTIGLQISKGSVDLARLNADILQATHIKQAIDLFYIQKGKYPTSVTELQNEGFLGRVVTAQKVDGKSIVLNDQGLGNSIIEINLVTGRVKVYDVSQGKADSNNPVWDSE